MLFEDVKQYVVENILHSEAFEAVDETKQKKAVRNAEHLLLSVYKRFNSTTKPLPIEAIAYQAIFMLAKDDSTLRADSGATYIGFSGVAITYAKVQRQISPDVIRILGRRTGGYARYIADTNRGMYDQ